MPLGSRHVRTPWPVTATAAVLLLVAGLLLALPGSASAGDTAYDGSARQAKALRLTGPGKVVDGRSLRLEVVWLGPGGVPQAGEVAIQRREKRRWKTMTKVSTAADGRAVVRLRPRVDMVLRARATAGGATSKRKRINNLPPGRRVSLPRGAPEPRVRVPRPPRAEGSGPNPRITQIPDDIWRQMTGRSWHPGCPVGRAGLRLVRINFWGFDGYRYRGELVAATGAADNMARALAEMYRRKFPIRSIYRVDRFGWSKRLQGANDYRSMAAGNTSAFNCRWVVGRPGVRSPHTYGRALDINPWENPYHSSHGIVPSRWWAGRSHRLVAWRSRSHPVVRIMARHGLRWTYGRSDSQHFDARGGHGRFVPVPTLCDGFPCH